MSEPPFTIRIHTENNQDMDWMVRLEDVTFRQTLEVISSLLPHVTVTAFEYEDPEDGDHITVRSDEEMQDMFSAYFRELSEEDRTRGLFPPLIIYPKMGKTPQNRNIHGLKIKTGGGSQAVEPLPQGQQRQEVGGSIQTIMQCGNINEAQLHFLEPVGSGSGGRVYRALHRPSGRVMAVKVIQLDISPAVQKQIICELEILYKCNSRAIIAFYGAFFQENRISICTEFMDGGSLDRYMPIPETVLGGIAACIVEGLIYMWNLKIMHRDIKPSNVLLNTAGEVKLCDFGVSVQLVKSITTTFVGTNVYMAPERLQGKDYGKSAEIWSLGVTLFELASGILPFQSLTSELKLQPFQVMQCILEETPLVLPTEQFSPEFVKFISQCMHKDPETRLSINDMVNHEFLHRHTSDSSTVISLWVKRRLQEIQQQNRAPQS
ncbi:dual specificity mitogen-activated protein kinase kinase 5-like [Littorina saxatilis]|uniref:mitogen-activated protein kinase kinase n=1 Tax=Littorina saxatilis TaxID=31220 RepID=A0AAN9C2P1_9CAEN